MDNLGAIFGPLLAIVLVAAVGTRWAIGVSVIPGLFAAMAIVYAIRHTPAPSSTHRAPIRLRVAPMLRGGLCRLSIGLSAFEFAAPRVPQSACCGPRSARSEVFGGGAVRGALHCVDTGFGSHSAGIALTRRRHNFVIAGRQAKPERAASIGVQQK